VIFLLVLLVGRRLACIGDVIAAQGDRTKATRPRRF